MRLFLSLPGRRLAMFFQIALYLCFVRHHTFTHSLTLINFTSLGFPEGDVDGSFAEECEVDLGAFHPRIPLTSFTN